MISMDISSADYRLFMDVSALLYGIDMKKGLYIKVDNKKRELSITDGSQIQHICIIQCRKCSGILTVMI